MVEKELLELDKIMVDSSVNIIKNKIEEFKNAPNLQDDSKNYLKYFESILRNIKRLEESEYYKGGVFNGNFIKSEITVLKILEEILKNFEALPLIQNDRIKYLFVIQNIHNDMDKIMSILEKYVDMD